jgi:hypothetical protein
MSRDSCQDIGGKASTLTASRPSVSGRLQASISDGRNWARILCTVLFGLATLELIRVRPQYPGGYLAHFAVGGHVYPVIHSVFGATVLGLIVPVLLWLAGLAAVWLLWRPASSAFFNGRVNPARTALS